MQQKDPEIKKRKLNPHIIIYKKEKTDEGY
jgi:hypothetical protein